LSIIAIGLQSSPTSGAPAARWRGASPQWCPCHQRGGSPSVARSVTRRRRPSVRSSAPC
jgi:hypothetical protein